MGHPLAIWPERRGGHGPRYAPDGGVRRGLYFVARDGSPWVPGQLGLWRTDGTGAATLVSTLPTPEREPDLQESPIVCSGARLYFVVSDPVSGHELWTSDGTEAGTRLLADVLPGPGSSSPSDLLVLEEALLFAAADDSHGRELWRTDGTTVGTTLLADIRPGPDGSFPSGLTWVNGQAFLSANDGTRGNELWRTDGASVTFVQGCRGRLRLVACRGARAGPRGSPLQRGRRRARSGAVAASFFRITALRHGHGEDRSAREAPPP